MDNRSCQACHQRRYESFASDHPEFGVWPYERRTRIVFDHVAHQAKHFAEKKQPFDCRSCHVEDATQSIELLAGYGAACAACHSENIQTSVALGVPMFVVPTVDVDALRAVGVDVGPWPEEATGDFDGRLPAAMKLLLAADPPAAEAMVTLGADFDFFDVDPDDEEQLRAAGKLAAAIKRLMAELSEVGPKAVRRRLSVMTGREIADEELNALVAGLSVDTLRPAVAEWLPDSAGGDGPWNRGDTSNGDEVRSDDGTDASVISFDPAGTWTRDDATLSIRYRPTGHADPVLATWLTATVELPNALGLPLKAALVKELTKPTAPGQCGSCHSVEGSKSGQLMVNWHAFNRLSEQRTLTKFDHGPHLLLPQLADCTACHALDPAANTAASYADYDPHTFVSEFLPISKRDCVQCHTPIAAGDHCQTCHNYHVDMVESWRRASRP